jgi:3,4-dihydroxy-2-butanone 4-phosphate synthase
VLPIAEAAGGLGERRGHTEGAVALARLAGLAPVTAMCELMAPDGHMARSAQALAFSSEHCIRWVSVAQVAAHIAHCQPEPAAE